MLNHLQMRAARGILGWKQEDLALVSRISLATIQRIEKGGGCHASSLMRIQKALEAAGVEILDENQQSIGRGFGVRLRNIKG